MTLADRVMADFKTIEFRSSESFRWSPEDNIIFFNNSSTNSSWSLLHEIGHVLCRHTDYKSDVGLLKMEVQAWQKALILAQKYNIKINQNHIEKCLDSYRNWLYRRSCCPKCWQAGIEKSFGLYSCINCSHNWEVTGEKFCRVYRRSLKTK